MTLEELAKRVQVLEDTEAIKNLKARYCEAADDYSNNHVGFSDLFTEDAVYDGGEVVGVHRGKQAISELMSEVHENWTFALHYSALCPNITVDGDTAHAHWYCLTAATVKDAGAVWGGAFYEDKYVKMNGKWFIKEVKLIPQFLTPYEEGWAKKRFPDD